MDYFVLPENLEKAKDKLTDLEEQATSFTMLIDLFLPFIWENRYVFRCDNLAPPIGASFVITQYHTSVMFSSRVVGTANAAMGMHNLFRTRIPVLLMAGLAHLPATASSLLLLNRALP